MARVRLMGAAWNPEWMEKVESLSPITSPLSPTDLWYKPQINIHFVNPLRSWGCLAQQSDKYRKLQYKLESEMYHMKDEEELLLRWENQRQFCWRRWWWSHIFWKKRGGVSNWKWEKKRVGNYFTSRNKRIEGRMESCKPLTYMLICMATKLCDKREERSRIGK